MKWALSLLLVLAAACGSDCGSGGADAPVVILVTIDTLRADHVGAYGATRARTPELDRFAAAGASFLRAYSQANVTLPSHASLLTSLPLARHGLTSNHGGGMAPVDSLPARFAAAGYRTAAFVSTPHLGPTFALGRALSGFEVYDAPQRPEDIRRAPETTDRLLRWLRGTCGERVFAWMHLWDPHMPYVPPAPHDRATYTGDPARPSTPALSEVELAWALYDLTGVRRAFARHARHVRSIKDHWHLGSRAVRRLMLDPSTAGTLVAASNDPSELARRAAELGRRVRGDLGFNRTLAGFLTGVEDLDYPRAQYAGEVSFVDAALGTLHETLVAWGLQDRAIVVLTSDHGEGLGEHDVYFDHFGAWEEMRHVPLVVWAPGRIPAGRPTTLTSGLDVAPTLLALAQLPVPRTMEGRDLFATPTPSGPIVLEHGRTLALTVHDGRWKLTRELAAHHYTTRVRTEPGRVTLFDLDTDPAERHDRAPTEPDRVAAMGALLDAWMAAHGLTPGQTSGGTLTGPPLSPERREQLRALGYLD